MFLKDVALFIIAPIVSLFYLVTFPVVAAAMLIRNWFKRRGPRP